MLHPSQHLLEGVEVGLAGYGCLGQLSSSGPLGLSWPRGCERSVVLACIVGVERLFQQCQAWSP